jgi:hypothetical protein
VQHIRSKGQIAELGAFIANLSGSDMTERGKYDRPLRQGPPGARTKAPSDVSVKSSDVGGGGRVVLAQAEEGRKKASFPEMEPKTRQLST